MLAVIPTDPPGRCKIDHDEALDRIGINHSSINRACVSAADLFRLMRHLALERERARGSGEFAHWSITVQEAFRDDRTGRARRRNINLSIRAAVRLDAVTDLASVAAVEHRPASATKISVDAMGIKTHNLLAMG
jgi:hypothetical protein